MRHLKRFNEDNSYSKTKKVSFDELSDRAKENARWEVEQGNKVKKYLSIHLYEYILYKHTITKQFE